MVGMIGKVRYMNRKWKMNKILGQKHGNKKYEKKKKYLLEGFNKEDERWKTEKYQMRKRCETDRYEMRKRCETDKY